MKITGFPLFLFLLFTAALFAAGCGDDCSSDCSATRIAYPDVP